MRQTQIIYLVYLVFTKCFSDIHHDCRNSSFNSFDKHLIQHTPFVLYLPHHLTHQTVKLRHWALVSRVTNVPDLDATLPSCVNVSGGVTDGNGAHHLSVVQSVDLTGVAWNPWAHQSIRGERHRLHLSVGRHVKGVSADDAKDDKGGKNEKRMVSLFICPEKTHQSFRGEIQTNGPQTYEQPQTHLRFAAGDSCQTGRHSRNSHVRMRIKTNLEERTQTFYEHSANTHPWALAKRTQVNTNLWNRTQTVVSTKQTDTLERTHTPSQSE